MKTIHFTLAIIVNEDTWKYQDPRVDANLAFEVPVDMFDSTKLAKLVDKAVKEADAKLEDHKREMEQAA